MVRHKTNNQTSLLNHSSGFRRYLAQLTDLMVSTWSTVNLRPIIDLFWNFYYLPKLHIKYPSFEIRPQTSEWVYGIQLRIYIDQLSVSLQTSAYYLFFIKLISAKFTPKLNVALHKLIRALVPLCINCSKISFFHFIKVFFEEINVAMLGYFITLVSVQITSIYIVRYV